MTVSTIPYQDIRELLQEFNLRHVAIIMDGNRRWANSRKMPAVFGHRKGVKALKAIIEYAGNVGLEALTVYAFSTENWRRTQEEVGALMALFAQALLQELEGMAKNNVRLSIIGELDILSPKLQSLIQKAEARLSENTGLQFQVAMNYGSRMELIKATQALAKKVQSGDMMPEQIDEAAIESHLYTRHAPSLDLLIRTGGESRLSNYLLWQVAYAEFYVTETLWPEFSPDVFQQAIVDFTTRKRRFGQ